MAMFTAPGAYDRAITVFSPDGRLFQVEYALETVKKGSTVLAIVSAEGVLLAAEEKMTSKLQDPSYTWKIFQIDDHIGVAISGLSSDARILVGQARMYAQSNKLMYDEPIDVEVLSKRIGDIEQLYTQHAGVRPFGVSMIIGGVDKTGSKILQTDPSGACWSYKAVAIGIGSDTVKEILESQYRAEMTMEEAISLAIECLAKVVEGGKLNPQEVRIVTIPNTTKKFTPQSTDVIVNHISKLKKDTGTFNG